MARPDVINREISWLSFNARVLQEAADPNVPLVERLKFIGIFSSNLEEFFRVRVAQLQRMVDAGIDVNKLVYGGSPKKILKQIHEVVVEQRASFDRVFAEVRTALEKENIYLIDEAQMLPEHHEFVQRYFDESVRPFLVPVILDSNNDFPSLKNGVIYLAVRLEAKQNGASPRHALIEVPTDRLPRFIVLPQVDDNYYVIMLDDVIRFGLKDVFAILDVDQASAYTIKLTRDAELEIDEDVTVSLVEKVSKSLKKRKEGPPVRFVYDRDVPKGLLELVMKRANLRKLDNAIAGGRYHNARDFVSFPNVIGPRLENEPQPPLPHPVLAQARNVFSVVRKQDVLLHLPYQSFQHVTELLREAAIDPKVKSIHITLYRVAPDSQVVNSLINAVRNGKKVTVLFELQARFDEERNIEWTRALEDEGARIIGGVPGLKVHAKAVLISRKEEGKLVDYALVGTGNFNEDTARLYTDHILMTRDPRITGEMRKFFDFLETNYRTHQYQRIMVSPFDMRRVLHKLIRREIKNAKAGKPAYIDVKLNSLVDMDLIRDLYEAGQAGVKIRLIVRGTCSLVPGKPGVSDNIEAISIVDRYLEHSRMFFFANGGNERAYLSSADWMTRNLDFRVELAVPVFDDAIRAELRHYFDLQLRDTSKARVLNEVQDNQYRRGERSYRAQVDIYRWLAGAAEHRDEDA